MTKINVIIEFLKSRYSAKVIILVGSRAVGDYKPNSDWDMFMFTDKKIRKETPREFYASYPKELKNEDLDLSKLSMDINTFPEKLWRNLRYSKILLDTKDKFGAKLVKKALAIKKKGPKKWTKEFAQGRIYKAQRYMKKFEDSLKEKNYEELYIRFAYHYTENLIDWWFGIRREFKLRQQQAIPYIKKKDPEYYKQIKKLVSDKTSYKTKINACKKMHKMIFEDKRFKALIN